MNLTGELRSFKNLKDDHEAYVEDGERRSRMKYFNNVINSSILKEDEEKLVIENVPIPELHLYLNHISNISRMLTSNIHIERWFKDKLIHFHGYNGGGLDGPNCRKVISKISELKSFLLSQHLYNYLVLADLLESFSKVADACFGMKLDSNFEKIIQNFIYKKNSAILEIKEYNAKISLLLNKFKKCIYKL